MPQSRAYHTRLERARQKRAQHAKPRRLQQQRERLQREQARAQRALQALEQAVQEFGLPKTVAEDVQWHLQAQQKLLSKIVGMMFPSCVRLSQLSGAVPGAGLG